MGKNSESKTMKESERAELAISEVVNEYFNGMYTTNELLLRKVFHSQIVMWGIRDGQVENVTLDGFIEKLKNLPIPSNIGEAFDMCIRSIDIDGPLAIARVEDLHLGKWFTDYLSLMNIDGKWIISGKTYYAHGGERNE